MEADQLKIIWNKLSVYLLPVFVFGGLIGNAVTLVVVKRHFTRCTSKVYLITLIIIQTLKIIIFALPYWISEVFGMKNGGRTWICKPVFTGAMICRSFGIYILVCACADRFVAVAFPFFWRSKVKVKHALIVVGVCFILSVVKDAYMFTMVRFIPVMGELLCLQVSDHHTNPYFSF